MHILIYPGGVEVSFLICTFLYFHTLCIQETKALARLGMCVGSSEHEISATTSIFIVAVFYYVNEDVNIGFIPKYLGQVSCFESCAPIHLRFITYEINFVK